MFRLFRKKDKSRQPQKMIVGLGNPGSEYSGTRHNIGFVAVNTLAKAAGIELKTFKHNARFGQGAVAGVDVLLVKPMSFMNRSGLPVRDLARKYEIAPEDILVVADDLDIPVGAIKMKPGGGAGGHNGHLSLIECLGTSDYPRLKIGIGRPEDETVEHVLSRFAQDEEPLIDGAVEKSWKTCEIWVGEGLDAALKFANTD